MYEAFFGLRCRPFSPLPRVETYIPLAPVREPFESLVRCIAQEQGIGVLTAPSGAGKSLVCRLLQQRFSTVRRTVLLTTARFPTRRALLQAILFELKHPFIGLSEQEARLRVLDLLQASPAPQNRMLLIVDEAHLLSPRGLEELRTLTDYEIAGTPCVTLILSGQLELEELLTEPDMNALNQRVGGHACIEPLTFEESSQYLRERLRFAGHDGLTIFTPEAIQLICSASEGNPRRLNQLSDHSLLLAYAEEERPVDVPIVRAALLDLRELPLHWNAPLDLTRETDRNPLEAFAETYEAEVADLNDEPLAECDTDIDLEEDSAFAASAWGHRSAETDQSEQSVFEVGAPLEESPIEHLFQITRFVVPREPLGAVEIEAPHGLSTPEPMSLSESFAFETTPPETEAVRMEYETEDETVSLETQPEQGLEWDGELPLGAVLQISPESTPSVSPSGFEELVVDDAYALIDRQLESNVRVPCPLLLAPLCQAPPASPEPSPVSPPVPTSGGEESTEDRDDTLFETASTPASIESPSNFERTTFDSEPVLLESQLLEFINEISVDVKQFRQELQASSEETTPSADCAEVPRPRHQSLRQSLNWQFDVVEPEAVEVAHDHSTQASQSEPRALRNEVADAARLRSKSHPVTHTTEAPREQAPVEERRYAQLFTRLQRQRRRVETVMNRERYSGTEVRQS